MLGLSIVTVNSWCCFALSSVFFSLLFFPGCRIHLPFYGSNGVIEVVGLLPIDRESCVFIVFGL